MTGRRDILPLLTGDTFTLYPIPTSLNKYTHKHLYKCVAFIQYVRTSARDYKQSQQRIDLGPNFKIMAHNF